MNRTGSRFLAVIVSAVTFSLTVSTDAARAVEQVPVGAGGSSRVSVDVWINKEEGGIYRPGESMQVFFRCNANAYVLVYNIDTEGYIHLVYPYGPSDPPRVEGGRSYRIPARHDPYDLVADGPPGMEFVVAVASRYPFRDLPWFLEGDAAEAAGSRSDDELDSGLIVGDPYVGMERLNRRILPPGSEDESDANETYFYIDRRVDYPRYVCADCHYPAFGFDPYLSVCPVVEIRIDATWVHYAPVRVSVARPRYYYWVRSNAPDRYRAWKDRWSSLDGASTLRSRFVLEPSRRSLRAREFNGRRQPPEFQNLRRNRSGRLWQGRDEVLRLWQDRNGRGRDRQNVAPPENRRPQGQGDRPGWWQRDRPQQREDPERRERRRDDSPQQQYQDPRRQDPRGRDHGERPEPQPQDRGRDRGDGDQNRGHDRGDQGRGRDHGDQGHDRDRGDHGRDQGQGQGRDGGDHRRDGDQDRDQGRGDGRGR